MPVRSGYAAVRGGYAAVRGGYAAVRRYGVLIGGAFPKASQFRVCRIRWSLVEVGTCASQPDTLGGVVKEPLYWAARWLRKRATAPVCARARAGARLFSREEPR